MEAEQEQLWVLRARVGDQEAFGKLVEAYQMPVYNLAYHMLGSATEAEDAAQETFVRVFTRFDSYDPTFKFSSWVLSIASHYCVDRLRRRRGNAQSLDESLSWQWLPDERPKPEEQALAHEQHVAIRGMLTHLPAQYRVVIILRYWYDLSYEEIAAMTQSTASAVKSRLHRAREMIGERLEEGSPAQKSDQPSTRRIGEHAMCRSF